MVTRVRRKAAASAAEAERREALRRYAALRDLARAYLACRQYEDDRGGDRDPLDVVSRRQFGTQRGTRRLPHGFGRDDHDADPSWEDAVRLIEDHPAG